MKSFGLAILIAIACTGAAVGAEKTYTAIEQAPSSTTERSSIAVGVHGGASLSRGTYDGTTRYSGPTTTVSGDSRTGLMFGGTAEFALSEIFFLQPEVNYVQKGLKNQFSSTNSRTLNFHYIEIPVLAKLKYDLGGFAPFLIAGPSAAVLIGQGYTTALDGTNYDVLLNANSFNRVSFFATGGAGADVALSPKIALVIDARYNRGLTNVLKKSFGGGSDLKYHSVQLLSGLQLAL